MIKQCKYLPRKFCCNTFGSPGIVSRENDFFSRTFCPYICENTLAVHGRAVVVGETDMNLWMREFSVYIRDIILDVPATMFHVGDGCKTCVILWLQSGGLHRCLGRWHGRGGCAASTTVTWKNRRYPRATWLILARWHDVRQPVVKLEMWKQIFHPLVVIILALEYV